MQEIILIVAIFVGLACLIGTFARAVLLPTAKLGQRARGFSDQVVTEIAVALPLGLFGQAQTGGYPKIQEVWVGVD